MKIICPNAAYVATNVHELRIIKYEAMKRYAKKSRRLRGDLMLNARTLELLMRIHVKK